MKRRTFIKTVGSVAGGLALTTDNLLAAEKANADATVETVEGMPRRVLGRTGEKLSVVGFPGLSLIHHTQEECTAGIHRAFERGINYFDVAPAYGGGKCETRMGIGLQGLDRSKYFLSCKTKMRDAEGARKELETSLKLLKTDYFDLYQMHHLVKPEDVKKALGPGGAIEAFLKAKEEGKVKYLGFSAHTTKAALAVMKGFKFDTVMFPLNFVEYYLRDFGKDVMELANKQGAALISIKPMSLGAWPKGMERTRKWWYRSVEKKPEVNLAWRWTLSQPGVVTGIPPSFLDLLDKAIDAAKVYRPPTKDEIQQCQQIAKGCESIFIREESMVAGTWHGHGPAFPDSPHECCRGHHA